MSKFDVEMLGETFEEEFQIVEFHYTELEKIRIDKYLASITDKSRTELKGLFDDGYVLVNQQVVKPSYLLSPSDYIVMSIPQPIISDVEKENIPLEIIYEDSDLIVVNKPSGMVVHPALGHQSGTLVNALMYHCQDLSKINGVIRPGIVHRIDKDTSGLLVVCKNDMSHREISNQLKEHKAERVYYAIVYGEITHNLGKVVAPIGRDYSNRQQMAVVEGGKPAVTHFRVVERFSGYTLIETRLETGRTHQIRVHLAYIGHPVLGDPVYGPRKVVGETGQFLHAKTLGFTHPRTGVYMEFTSELPQDFNKKIAELRLL